VITARRYLATGETVDVAPEDISEVHHLAGGVLWVDATDPTDEELAMLADEFGLHPLAIEDAQHHGQRPKLDRYPTHVFVVAYSAQDSEVDLFVGPGWLLCVRERNTRGVVWDPAPALLHFERTVTIGPTVGNLLHAVLDTLVDGYFDAFEAAEDLLETLEDEIFGETPLTESEVQRRFFTVRRDLVRYRRRLVPLREVLAAILRREVAWIDGEALLAFQDVYDHVLRAVDMVDSARELMGNAVDAHLAIISNRMNKVMKTMTSWGAILFGAGLIAGVYGMNFRHMPELSWKIGYPMALGMMALLTVVLTIVFRRRDWL
jgi:magnesium transporter